MDGMAEERIHELRQEEVFAFIDRELKKGRSNTSSRITQRTHRNFTMVLAIDLLAVAIAAAGFVGIYSIFKAREINLVGNERSIKGLEDVLYQEMRKKANADLSQKQQELQDTRNRLSLLNNQMESIKKDQEKLVQERLDKIKREMNSKLESDLRNKTEQEKEEIRRKYEEQLKNANKTVEQDAANELKKRQDELAKLQTEKDQLELANRKRQQEMEKSQSDLRKSNEDLQKQLADSQKAKSHEMEQLSTGLEDRKKQEAFYDQVNTLFRSAIAAYGRKDFNSVRDRLTAVERLYMNHPSDVVIGADRESVDRFFLDTLRDYLSIKENTANPDQKKYQELLIGLQGMRDLGLQLARGDYRGRKTEADAKIEDFRKLVPEAFDYYRGYDIWRSTADDTATAALLKTADSFYEDSDFKGAATRYLSVIRQNPTVANRNDILDKLNHSVLSLSEIGGKKQMEIDIEAINSNAAPVFRKANEALARGDSDSALNGFQSVITVYPNSRYTKDSLQVIRGIYDDRLATAFSNAMKSFQEQENRKIEADNLKADGIYREGMALAAKMQFSVAFEKMRLVLTKFPRSASVQPAADAMQGIFEKLSAQVPTNSISLRREEQDSNAEPVFHEAKRLESAGEFTTARKAYESIIENCPYSSFVRDSVAGMERIMDAQTQKFVEKASPVQLSDDQLLSLSVGRVVEIRDDVVGMNLTSEKNISPGTTLEVYRKNGDGKFDRVAELQVMDLSGFIERAKIVSKTGEVRPGDLLYGK
jgi:hypothetical protein